MIIAAQTQVWNTSNMQNELSGENVSPMCRLCDWKEETAANIVSECTKLLQNEYKKTIHDNAANVIHWRLWKNGHLKELINGMDINL